MSYVLFVATAPEGDVSSPQTTEQQHWDLFLNALDKKTDKGLTAYKLGTNVWLLPLDGGLPTLSELMQAAKNNCSYKTSLIEGEITPLGDK